MAGGRSLNPESDRQGEAKHWAVFTDVALAMLLVLILFILAQFLHYEKIHIIEEVARRQAEVEQEIRSDSQLTGGIRSIEKQDDFHQRISFTSDFLFEPCRTEVQIEGATFIRRLTEILSERMPYFEEIHIEGHTDTRPPGQNCPVADNWELSAGRATQVLRILSAFEQFPDAMLSSVGRGEFHPLADGNTPEAHAENRRIEIIVRYSEDVQRGLATDG